MKAGVDVSVIIPIYNTAPYLRRCFDSVVRGLGMLRYEVFLMDDGSTDESPEIAKIYADSHEGFYYHRLEHGGQGKARNIGLDYAKGRYIHFMDSDDFLLPGIVEKMHIVAESEHADFTMCNGVLFDKDKIKLNVYELRCFSHIGMDDHVTSLSKNPYLVWDTTMTHKLIRREFLDKHKIRFPQIIAFEDMLPVLKLYSYADRITTIRTRGYVYRIREDLGNTIRKVDYGFFLKKLEVMRGLLHFAKKSDIPAKAVSELEYKCVNGDFTYFLNNLSEFGENQANVVVGLEELIKECISEETLNRLPLSFKQIVCDIKNHDIKHLLETISYKNTDYSKAPVVKTASGSYELQPDESIIKITKRNADCDFAYSVPATHVRNIEKKGFHFIITGHMYTNRINLEKSEDQEIKAYLQNELTGKYIEIPLERIRSEYLTELKYSPDDMVHYNYDEAGFRLEFDFESIAADDAFLGKNLIVLRYKTELFSGYRALRGFSKNAEKACRDMKYLLDDRYITIREEQDGTLIVQIVSSEDDTAMKVAVRSLKEEKQLLTEKNTLLADSNKTTIKRCKKLILQNNLYKKELEKEKKKLHKLREEYEQKKQAYRFALNEAKEKTEQMESAATRSENCGIKNYTGIGIGNSEKVYIIIYHCDESSAPSPESTAVVFGNLTKTKTVSELGFEKAGKQFLGWKAYREIDGTWFLKDSDGKNAYKKLEGDQLPKGHTFVLYKNGEPVKKTVTGGIVHFYAQWEK